MRARAAWEKRGIGGVVCSLVPWTGWHHLLGAQAGIGAGLAPGPVSQAGEVCPSGRYVMCLLARLEVVARWRTGSMAILEA